MKDLGDNDRYTGKTKVTAGARDRKKHCDFHNDPGHNTDECITLCYEEMKLLKKKNTDWTCSLSKVNKTGR